MHVFETSRLTNPRFIINFPTKRHWRNKSRMEDVEAGLEALVEEIRARGASSRSRYRRWVPGWAASIGPTSESGSSEP